MPLRLVVSTPDFFAFAGDAEVRTRKSFGCACGRCGRKVSAPFGFERSLIWCIYCGMEAGYVPMVENPWGHRWSCGVTREECVEDRAALSRGEFETMAEARARRQGRILELF